LRLSRLFCMVLFFFLTIGAAIPDVHAQTTTMNPLNVPQVVVYGSPQQTAVTLVVSYQDAKPGDALVVGLYDDEKGEELMGTATASPDPCLPSSELSVITACIVSLVAASGQEEVTFRFSTTDNPHAPGEWRLKAISGLQGEDGEVIQGSLYSGGFSVQVVSAVEVNTGKTQTTPVARPTDSSVDALPVIVAVILGLFVVGAVSTLYDTRRKKRRAKRRR